MWVYWLLFVLIGWNALSKMRPVYAGSRTSYQGIRGVGWFIILVLLIGYRHEVGGDWQAYLIAVEKAAEKPILRYAWFGADQGYSLLNWLGANIGGGIYFVNTVCAALFCWGLFTYCRFQPRPELALMIAVPVLIIVIGMGYTRQAVGIGMGMIALIALQNGRFIRFLVFVILAALFHKTALILLPFGLFYGFKNRFIIILAILICSCFFFVLLVQEYVDVIIRAYIETQYESSGAAVRIAMNAIPALIFLIWRKRFRLTAKQQNFWTWMSCFALGLVVLMFISPSSTAVDRIGFYWIPLQLMVWSHVPDVFGRRGKRNPFWVYVIAAYSASVLFIWLLFSNHSELWLPYQFYPFTLFWS